MVFLCETLWSNTLHQNNSEEPYDHNTLRKVTTYQCSKCLTTGQTNTSKTVMYEMKEMSSEPMPKRPRPIPQDTLIYKTIFQWTNKYQWLYLPANPESKTNTLTMETNPHQYMNQETHQKTWRSSTNLICPRMDQQFLQDLEEMKTVTSRIRSI